MMPPSLAQRRAKHALLRINTLKDAGPAQYGRYASYVSALPATILNSGLGQAMAQLLAAAGRKNEPTKDPHYLLYMHVEDWICKGSPVAVRRNVEPGQEVPSQDINLIQTIINGDQRAYLLAQAEALAYLEWLKKFARAMLEKPEGTEPS